MDKKTTTKLELDKILDRLSGYAAFSASRELLEQLTPTRSLDEALYRQQETSEARDLLAEHELVSVGGARDVRPYAGYARREITLSAEQLLAIQATLISAEKLKNTITRASERYPLLAEYAIGLDGGKPVVNAITSTIDDNGEVMDSASPELARVRRELQVTHSRLQSRMQGLLSKHATYLQEALITQRDGRYVLPVKADARGRVKGIVHDHSSSGATIFVEPLETVEINNQIRELGIAEQNEILRILRNLTLLVGNHADTIHWTVDALASLDAAFAKAKFANVMLANEPQLVDFEANRMPGSTIRLYNARHPLIDAAQVVPIDVEIDADTYMLVITGPNTGGKTVSLKTVGLLTLMAQCGLHIPASADSVLTVFDAVYADIGDEQSIEQSLSTFSAHLTHIIDILKNVDDRSLVLLDELGSGTDPAEGAAIARAIMNDLLERGITTFVATHYPELKLYAHSTRGVRNASMEFDVETLSPTYRLIIGLPGRSNALAIATRLGLDNRIINEARGYVGADDLHADDLLDEIHRTRDEIRFMQDRLLRTEEDARILRDRLQQRLDDIERERDGILETARIEAHTELEILQQEMAELRRKLQAVPPTYKAEKDASSEALREIESSAGVLTELVSKPQKSRKARKSSPGEPEVPAEQDTPAELEIGDLVFVFSLNSEGEIVSINGDDLEVQVGQFRVRTAAEGVEYRSKRESKRKRAEAGSSSPAPKKPRPESPGLELHLLGLTLDDALPLLEEYLDQAYLSGLPWVRIVHGKGTGVLRRGVRDTLSKSPLIKGHKSAAANDGGDGVTIAHFVPLS